MTEMQLEELYEDMPVINTHTVMEEFFRDNKGQAIFHFTCSKCSSKYMLVNNELCYYELYLPCDCGDSGGY